MEDLLLDANMCVRNLLRLGIRQRQRDHCGVVAAVGEHPRGVSKGERDIAEPHQRKYDEVVPSQKFGHQHVDYVKT